MEDWGRWVWQDAVSANNWGFWRWVEVSGHVSGDGWAWRSSRPEAGEGTQEGDLMVARGLRQPGDINTDLHW